MKDLNLYSIVIPTCNRPDALSLCLDSLAPGRQIGFPDRYEVIVTDDGSKPAENLLKVKYPWVKWVQGPRRGPAANRNNGAEHARGQWLLFLDDDCIPDQDLLKNYISSIDLNHSIKVFEGRIYTNTAKYSLGLTSPVNLTGGYLWACNFMIERDFFKELQGFDEIFPFAAMEDVDLRIRINKKNHQILFVKDASVCHPWRRIGGWKKVMEHNRSTFVFLKKHPEERERINTSFYIKFTSRDFLYETLPGIFKFKGRGLGLALTQHAGFVMMAFKLLFKK